MWLKLNRPLATELFHSPLPLELLSDMHWTPQFLCTLSGGGAGVNANVRVRRSTVPAKCLRLPSACVKTNWVNSLANIPDFTFRSFVKTALVTHTFGRIEKYRENDSPEIRRKSISSPLQTELRKTPAGAEIPQSPEIHWRHSSEKMKFTGDPHVIAKGRDFALSGFTSQLSGEKLNRTVGVCVWKIKGK